MILAKIAMIVNDKKIITKLHLIEEKKIYSSAWTIGNNLAQQLENRVSLRLALRDLLKQTSREREIKGIEICVSGRVDGAEIAQRKITKQGKMPLSTLVSFIEHSQIEANTTYGKIGITVLVYKLKEGKK